MEVAAREVDSSGPARVEIDLGSVSVPIDITSFDSATDWILNNPRNCWEIVVTPNLHHLRLVRNSPTLASNYSEASLSLPDGWPVAWLASRRSGKQVKRVAGADLFQAVINHHGAGRPLVLVGGTPGPKLDDLSTKCRSSGWIVSSEPAPRAEILHPSARSELVARIAQLASGGIAVIGVGSPRQEELAKEMAELSGNGAILCLGMSINFSAGVVNRAPKVVQSVGLEWFYRALSEPRRLLSRYLLDAFALPPLILRNLRHR